MPTVWTGAAIPSVITWGVMVACSLSITAAKFAARGPAASGQWAGRRVWYVMVIAGVWSAVILAILVADTVSHGLIDASASGGQSAQELLAGQHRDVRLGVVLALLVIAATLGQLVLLIVRLVVLGVLVGLLPFALAAAIATGDYKRLRTTMVWLLGWTASTPAAASLYLSAIDVVGQGTGPPDIGNALLLSLLIAALAVWIGLAVPGAVAAARESAPGTNRTPPRAGLDPDRSSTGHGR